MGCTVVNVNHLLLAVMTCRYHWFFRLISRELERGRALHVNCKQTVSFIETKNEQSIIVTYKPIHNMT